MVKRNLIPQNLGMPQEEAEVEAPPAPLKTDKRLAKPHSEVSRAGRPATVPSTKVSRPNAWLDYVKEVRQENPSLSYKEALVKAKETYRK